MILNTDSRYIPTLYKNAPSGNLDRILDNESNETINLDKVTKRYLAYSLLIFVFIY